MPAGIGSSLNSLQVKLGANPAAGNEVSYTVPAGKTWLVVSLSVLLVQGITQTPQPILVADDGSNVLLEAFGSSTAQAVSTTCRYTWAPELLTTSQIGTAANVHSTAGIPEGLVLGPGYRISTNTLGIGANSDYGVPALLVVEYG